MELEDLNKNTNIVEVNIGHMINGAIFLAVVEALMDMVNQHCTYEGKIDTWGLSANELAFEVLEELGFMKTDEKGKYLDWKHKYQYWG